MKAYAVAIGNVSKNKRSLKALKYISTLDGFVGIHPHYPDGTLILFDSKNNAKIGKNLMESKGIQTGYNICEVDYDTNEKGGE